MSKVIYNIPLIVVILIWRNILYTLKKGRKVYDVNVVYQSQRWPVLEVRLLTLKSDQ